MDGPRRAMLSALANAKVNVDQVQYLNAHGTSTPLGDINETQAIKAAFGEHARRMVVSSTKSMTGHLLGGAGGIESVYTVLALHHQKVPPTINLDNQDPDIILDVVTSPRTLPEGPLVAISNSFGFGGHNAVAAFRSYP
jgi:3-oxoacyl-[acyl-carrier-protein] synthase II